MAKTKAQDPVAVAAGVEEELDQPVTWRALLAFCYKRGMLPTPPEQPAPAPSEPAPKDGQ